MSLYPKVWPRLEPALQVFPTLQRFGPTFAPRRIPRLPPGGHPDDDVPFEFRRASVRHLYHDLGVLVYAGATVRQTDSISKLLNKITTNDGTLPHLRAAVVHSPAYTRCIKYRLATEDRHIEKGWREKEGVLSSVGVYDLGSQAASRWMHETMAVTQQKYPEIGLAHLRESHIHVHRGLFTKGIIHETVNGPRRLSVDAHVMAIRKPNGLVLVIELYAVGTSTYVGKLSVGLAAFDGENPEPFEDAELYKIFQSSPHSENLPQKHDVQKITDSLWELEKRIWADRVDWSMYPKAASVHAPAIDERSHD